VNGVIPLLVAIGLTIVVIESFHFGAKLMAQAADLTASFNGLSAAVKALADAFAAKAFGVDPAALDPIKQGMDDLTAAVNNVLNPPPAGS
jgi:hypothetical protein